MYHWYKAIILKIVATKNKVNKSAYSEYTAPYIILSNSDPIVTDIIMVSMPIKDATIIRKRYSELNSVISWLE